MKVRKRESGIKDKTCTGADLVKALENVSLTPKEAREWHKDQLAARKALKPQRNKWE